MNLDIFDFVTGVIFIIAITFLITAFFIFAFIEKDYVKKSSVRLIAPGVVEQIENSEK